jgi:HSP20 family protein
MMRFDFPWAGEMNRLQNELDRLFGDRGATSLLDVRAFPAINLWEDDENFYVESEIPGMEMQEFELFVNEDNQLTIQGERKQPNGDAAIRHREERAFGRFSRIIPLPAAVNGDATTAEYKAGVLRITLPRKEETKPRRIVVAAG